MFNKIMSASFVDDYIIYAQFASGVTKKYSVKKLFDEIKIFNKLKENDLFYQGVVDTGGYGVSWNDKIDLSADEIWENGKEVKTRFDNILAIGEATKLWGLDDSTIRKAIARGKFVSGIDTQKFGKQWVITKEAMKREYGMCNK